MKASATEVIRRGFENTIANWPLLLIRIGEGVLMMILAIGAIIAIIVPIALSLGLNTMTIENPADLFETVMAILVDQWMVIVYVIAVVTLMITIFVAIHSFVEAGSARVYIDGERIAGPGAFGPRERFKVFSVEKWLEGGKRDWWSVFWIYNFAWAIASLIILAPFLAAAALIFVVRDEPAAMAGIGCLAVAFLMFFTLAVIVVTNIWCQKAIVVCAARTHRAVGALGEAWREFRMDTGRHIGVALILFLLTIVGTGVFASISAISGISDSPSFALAMMPMQMIGSFANTVFSTIMGAWFLACFSALSVDPR
jgi:hypothetical protein